MGVAIRVQPRAWVGHVRGGVGDTRIDVALLIPALHSEVVPDNRRLGRSRNLDAEAAISVDGIAGAARLPRRAD